MTRSAVLTLCFVVAVQSAPSALLGCKILDMTHTLRGNIPKFPGFPAFQYYKTLNELGPGKRVRVYHHYLKMAEHIGTHLDAPNHFGHLNEHKDTWVSKRQSMEELQLENMSGEACVLDISKEVEESNRKWGLTVEWIKRWEERHGQIDDRCIVILNTGQGKYWAEPEKYLGTKDLSDFSTMQIASFTGEAAEYIVSKKVRAVGVDTLSLDNTTGNTNGFPAHMQFLYKGNIAGLENMANTHLLPPRGATVMIAPMKMEGGSGGAARAFAVGWQKDDPCSLYPTNAGGRLETAVSGPLVLMGTMVLWLLQGFAAH